MKKKWLLFASALTAVVLLGSCSSAGEDASAAEPDMTIKFCATS